jgi:hypothetical protein
VTANAAAGRSGRSSSTLSLSMIVALASREWAFHAGPV